MCRSNVKNLIYNSRNNNFPASIDLVICNNKKAKGISVFSLSDKASDKEALLLAKRENEVDIILNNNEKIEDPLIYGTLIKMFQR